MHSQFAPLSPGNLTERHYEMLVQAVVDYAIFMLDPAGFVVSWNAGAARTKGYAAAEAIGQHLSIFYTEEDRCAGKPGYLLDRARREGRAQDEGWRVRKDGTRFWALVVIDAIRNEQGDIIGLAKITRDITDRREAEGRYDALRAQLFQAQKLEALGQLTGGMAHDFNNLLTIILSAAKLASRTDDPERLASLLDNIQTAGERGAQMTRNLLTFARCEPKPSRLVDLNQLLDAASTFISQALPKTMTLEMQVDEALHAVQLDPSELEMALLNLILNARDAMSGSGVVRLEASNQRLAGDVEGLQGEFVLIAVADQGCGIDPAIRPRLFEPFFTTKDIGKGTGLGLSQVYGFARQAGGSVQIESTAGQGTTMQLYLPAGSAQAADAGE
ncbi:nitrogen regulation protein NR(II) [Pseudomonas sp. URMO17WK12:I2]|uniref:two-component system sensor histidine kinase NtrB n=1 Tax=Pseudomonas sp. URMO17WK12:I2 TaxID=1261623 RepID=UPI000DAD4643|nr:ATP-binding protein [Pseudomonas sp. URMO17WK12:I2]PZW47341.1 PAS domain S-box-containing protein [Pseudomonas sp. URMO17WK12:I2]